MTTPTTDKFVLYGEQTTLSVAGTVVAQVISIDGLGASRAKIGINTLGDSVKMNRTSSLEDVKDVKVTVLYSPTAHGSLLRGWLEAVPPANEETIAIAFFQQGQTTAAETYSNTKAYATDWTINNVKEDGNVEMEVTIAANALWTTGGTT
jgi:hypothetical protein